MFIEEHSLHRVCQAKKKPLHSKKPKTLFSKGIGVGGGGQGKMCTLICSTLAYLILIVARSLPQPYVR